MNAKKLSKLRHRSTQPPTIVRRTATFTDWHEARGFAFLLAKEGAPLARFANINGVYFIQWEPRL